jgi:hypothetical protein
LAALPTATVKDTIVITYETGGEGNVLLNFWAASDSARTATGSRGAIVYHDYSIDGGVTYSTPTQVGDSLTFPRRPTPYALYSVAFAVPQSTTCKSRFIVSRGAGLGTAARFLMDDFELVRVVGNDTKRHLDQQSMRIVPNPNSGIFQVNLNHTMVENATVEIFDIVGKRTWLAQNVSFSDTWTIPQPLQKGVYTLKIATADQTFVQKVVVE